MNMPGLTAGASLYKSSRQYFLGTGWTSVADSHLALPPLQPAGLVVAQQDCQSQCASQYQQCLNSCGCPPGYTNCGGTCVDLNFDTSNCGACGHRCNNYPGLFCGNGNVPVRIPSRVLQLG